MPKCRLCPYKKVCQAECYGEDPCTFAITFDRLSRKVNRLKLSVCSLKQERDRASSSIPQHRVFGEYVMTPVPNAFSSRTSWWISRKDRVLAHYCFTAADQKKRTT